MKITTLLISLLVLSWSAGCQQKILVYRLNPAAVFELADAARTAANGASKSARLTFGVAEGFTAGGPVMVVPVTLGASISSSTQVSMEIDFDLLQAPESEILNVPGEPERYLYDPNSRLLKRVE